GNNTYTAGTTINAGTLQIGNGGTNGSIAGNVIDNGTLAFNRSDSVTFGGLISGTGSVTQTGSGTLILTAAGNTYGGGTNLNAGIVAVNTDGNLGTGVLTFKGGTLEALAAGGGIVSSKAVTLLANGGTFLADPGTTSSLNGVISGIGGLTKSGTGMTILAGANTYSGNTTVNAGTLLVDGSIQAGLVSVASGATLGGTGTIGGPVTIQNGGILAPGNSPGTLTMGTLTLNSGSVSNYQLGAPNAIGGGVNDLVIVNGNLTLAGTLNVSNAGGFGSGVYRLFNYTGSLTNGGLSLNTVPAGFSPADFIVQTTQPGQVNLVVSSSGFATEFWDGTTTVADGIIHGGSATWNGTTDDWTNAAAAANAPWENGFAIFEGTAGTVTLGTNIEFDGMQFLTGGYTIAAAGPQTLIGATTTTIDVGSGLTATISAPIMDGTSPAAVSKTDLGTLILTGSNTYTGGTTIAAGTLQIGNGGTTGSIVGNVADNGALVFDRSDIITFGGTISGSGSLTQEGIGTVILTGTNTYSGGTTIGSGTLQLGNGAASGSILGNVINNGILAINRSDIFTFAALISGSGSFQQTGAGITILTGVNTYSGATNITAGTLQAGSSAALSANSAFSVGATLDLHGFNNTIGSLSGSGVVTNDGVSPATLSAGGNNTNTTFSGTLTDGSASLGFTKAGIGTMILSGGNTYTGGTTVSSGTLQIGNGATSGSIVGNVTDNGILAFNRSDSVTFGGVITGTGSLVQMGPGTLILTAADSYTGGTTINAGATLQLGNGSTTGSIAGNETDNGTLALNRTDTVTLGVGISGAGGFVQSGSGTVILTGNNTYTAGTTINAGTLQTPCS
ncbi:MAG: autotransporter-associated beta strand repeat-containing protein, partial [Verrucomicrobia bacterium]|nr:autotransporter-associated beta strand repeat-containing protein [Verrucomicrobiota bacterium]